MLNFVNDIICKPRRASRIFALAQVYGFPDAKSSCQKQYTPSNPFMRTGPARTGGGGLFY